MPPFIQYHTDSVSTSSVNYNIYFSVGIFLSIQFALLEV